MDQANVVGALGMKNAKLVANRVGIIKKKHNLPPSTFSKAAVAGNAASSGPVIPKTTATKKAPAKKGGSEIICWSGTWIEVNLGFCAGICRSKVLRRLRRRGLRTKLSKKLNKRLRRRLTLVLRTQMLR
jgi:hypothetical protein